VLDFGLKKFDLFEHIYLLVSINVNDAALV
jgi:hypothetical protein